ncbi:hypothetical protein CDAR_421661 [Caerostris darwini]|uniref:Uncharacterized protein n=1 Tax=Caerostris darwini TaxID=1538125 RepID=A0AAV4UZQ6_9ARAC|nr:hypothetical protein CDAR_421661 [Caerostris darwini]
MPALHFDDRTLCSNQIKGIEIRLFSFKKRAQLIINGSSLFVVFQCRSVMVGNCAYERSSLEWSVWVFLPAGAVFMVDIKTSLLGFCICRLCSSFSVGN